MARPLTTPRSRRLRRGDDRGFTVIEVTVAIALVTIVMTALAGFFVNSAATTDVQGQKQSAVRVATDAVEKARSLTAVGLERNRGRTASENQWAKATDNSQFPGVAAYLTDVTMAYDSAASASSGPSAPLSTDGNPMSLDGTTFTQNWFLGTCMQNPAGKCTSGTGVALTKFMLVVVAVTWANRACANRKCIYITTTLVSPTPDPDFDASQGAPRPKIDNPGNQSNQTGDTVQLPLSVSGGTAPLSWTPPATLPPGLRWGADSTKCPTSSVCIYGSPTAAVSLLKITLSVEDAFGFTSTATFKWSVTEALKLTSPTTTTRNDTYKDTPVLQPTARGGTAPYSWSAANLPSGMTINGSTGRISGTLNFGYRWLTTVTVTDADGSNDSATFAWYVSGDVKLDMAADGDRTNTRGQAVSAVSPTASWQYENVSGVTKKWSASSLPSGLSLNTTTGRITGTPTTVGTFNVQIAVTYYYNGSAYTVGVNQFVWKIS